LFFLRKELNIKGAGAAPLTLGMLLIMGEMLLGGDRVAFCGERILRVY